MVADSVPTFDTTKEIASSILWYRDNELFVKIKQLIIFDIGLGLWGDSLSLSCLPIIRYKPTHNHFI
jgi:hypothetical protein